jgi:dTDP-4-dehydrorhamnose 3,5-epimerase
LSPEGRRKDGMKVTRSNGIPQIVILEPDLFCDHRGKFLEVYHAQRYEDYGILGGFVQDNLSVSRKGVVRGLHYQIGRPQAKLIWVARGEIYDVAVDLRRGSPTFGRWEGAVLSSENHRQIYVPEGFAHGFCVLSEEATVVYKCSDFYAPSEERGLRWDDPQVGIRWPVRDPILSDKDRALPTLEEIAPADLPA